MSNNYCLKASGKQIVELARLMDVHSRRTGFDEPILYLGDACRLEPMAKIPPTMRVREGDTVLMRFGEEVKSVKIRAVTNTTLFETDEGIVFPDSIEKWPWEFEQKGGDK